MHSIVQHSYKKTLQDNPWDYILQYQNMDVKKSVCFLSWLDYHQSIMDVKSLLQNFLTFFEKERDGRSRIGLHKPMQRLIEGSGLTLHQVRYILHQKESRARSRENVSFLHWINDHIYIIFYLFMRTIHYHYPTWNYSSTIL